MMGNEGGTLPLTVYACATVPVVGPPRGACVCVQDVGGGLSGPTAQVSDESALEVCIHDDALYKSTFFTF